MRVAYEEDTFLNTSFEPAWMSEYLKPDFCQGGILVLEFDMPF